MGELKRTIPIPACRACNEARGNDWPYHRGCSECPESIRRHRDKGITRQGVPDGWVKPTRSGRTSYVPKQARLNLEEKK